MRSTLALALNSTGKVTSWNSATMEKEHDAQLAGKAVVKQQAHQQHRHRERGTKLADRDDRAADAGGDISHRVLHCVARLVRRRADGRHRCTVVDRVRQADDISRVIVVGQVPAICSTRI